MPKIRLKLDPLSASGGTSGLVSGLTLSLIRRGPGTTLATREAEAPATISFQARFLPVLGGAAAPRGDALATLTGAIALDPTDGRPRFTVAEAESAFTDFIAAQALPEDPPPRKLRLDLDPDQFVGAELLAPLALSLPLVSEQEFSHAEVEATLTINGQTEAAAGESDVLDVPLSPRPQFILQVVDELGEPLAGIDIEVSVLGQPNQLLTDASGFVRVDDMAADGAAIRFLDADAVVELLKQRWASPRVGAYIHAAPGIATVPVKGLADAVIVQSARRMCLSVQPRVVQARVTGPMFDLDKSFVRPEAIPSLRGLRQVYDENPGSKLLLVGHTDTSGGESNNDSLSLERAESMAAYLRDDVEVWFGRYSANTSAARRWGRTEDLLMLSGMTPGVVPTTLDAASILAYQKAHNALAPDRQSKTFANLIEDGKLGDATRRQLIADYMNQDDTSLPEDVEVVTHGCGEHFPLADGATELDSRPEDGVRDADDRRVELFFFEPELGIIPPPPGKNSKKSNHEYREWRRRATETREFETGLNERLTVTAFGATAASDLTLLIDQADDRPIASARLEQGRVDGDAVSFDFVPELLPAAVQFRVQRGGEVREESGVVQPLVLRDALFRRDFDTATAQVTRGTSAPSGAKSRSAVVATPSTAAAGTNPTDFFLLFHWANPNHRFLQGMSFTLTGNNGQTLAEANGSVLGAKKFQIPDSIDSVQLVVDVKSPLVGSILTINQNININRQPGRPATVSYGTSNFRTGAQHPRVRPLSYAAGGNMPAIELDLLFLDVTNHLLRGGNFPITFSTFVTGQTLPVNQMQCTYRVLEHTGGRPTTWLVALPPTLDATDPATNVFLFFRHELLHRATNGSTVDGAHRNSDEADLDGNLFYFATAVNPGKYVNSSGSGNYVAYPRCGWDQQLRASRKKVVMFFPQPHIASFGVLDQPSASSKALLTSALTALFADNNLASAQGQRPFIKRLAAGGWSSGTDTLFKWADPVKGPRFLDELYVFDGKRDYPVNFKDWFELDPGRRSLHLIGTAYTEVAANRVKRVMNNPNVFVEPGNPRYWYEDAGYLSALSAGNGPPRRFRTNPAAPPLVNDASLKTDIFVAGETLINDPGGISVTRSITFFSSRPDVVPRTIKNVGHEEAALFMLIDVVGGIAPEHAANATQAEFDRIIAKADIQPLIKNKPNPEPVHSFRHRHPWSVMGGLFNDQGRPFVGYFQLCLERGRFA